MTPRIDEVAPDLYRISLYVKDFDLQFNHFLIRDDEPPASRVTVTLTAGPANGRRIGEYVLDHSAR